MFYIIADDTARRSRWFELFGVDRLPVVSRIPRPRLQPVRGRVPVERLCYEIDANRLTSGARAALASYISRRAGLAYIDAVHMVDRFPIPATGCTVIDVELNNEEQTAVDNQRSFAFASTGSAPYHHARMTAYA
jgi:hypothetical protein